MEVKDVQKQTIEPVQSQKTGSGKKPRQLQRALSSLTASSVDAARSESVRVDVESRQSRNEAIRNNRERANSLINVVNFAAEATSEIEKLVQSVGGIVEQVDQDDLPPERSQVLEREAKELVEEIRRQANAPGPGGIRPLAGDKVRVDLEEKLGRTLEVMLPEDASKAFGLSVVNFSNKDMILKTRSSIEEARQRLAELKNAVEGVRASVAQSVTELEVALQNSEAATATIRDVEGALEVGNAVKSEIRSRPEQALESVGQLHKGSAEQLLNPNDER